MDKGQGSRNQVAKIEEFKGYITTVDSPAMGIDVAEDMINAAYDLDGGIRKREGIKTAENFSSLHRQKMFFVKSRKTKTALKNVGNYYDVEVDSNGAEKNALTENSFDFTIKDGTFVPEYFYVDENLNAVNSSGVATIRDNVIRTDIDPSLIKFTIKDNQYRNAIPEKSSDSNSNLDTLTLNSYYGDIPTRGKEIIIYINNTVYLDPINPDLREPHMTLRLKDYNGRNVFEYQYTLKGIGNTVSTDGNGVGVSRPNPYTIQLEAGWIYAFYDGMERPQKIGQFKTPDRTPEPPSIDAASPIDENKIVDSFRTSIAEFGYKDFYSDITTDKFGNVFYAFGKNIYVVERKVDGTYEKPRLITGLSFGNSNKVISLHVWDSSNDYSIENTKIRQFISYLTDSMVYIHGHTIEHNFSDGIKVIGTSERNGVILRESGLFSHVAEKSSDDLTIIDGTRQTNENIVSVTSNGDIVYFGTDYGGVYAKNIIRGGVDVIVSPLAGTKSYPVNAIAFSASVQYGGTNGLIFSRGNSLFHITPQSTAISSLSGKEMFRTTRTQQLIFTTANYDLPNKIDESIIKTIPGGQTIKVAISGAGTGANSPIKFNNTQSSIAVPEVIQDIKVNVYGEVFVLSNLGNVYYKGLNKTSFVGVATMPLINSDDVLELKTYKPKQTTPPFFFMRCPHISVLKNATDNNAIASYNNIGRTIFKEITFNGIKLSKDIIPNKLTMNFNQLKDDEQLEISEYNNDGSITTVLKTKLELSNIGLNPVDSNKALINGDPVHIVEINNANLSNYLTHDQHIVGLYGDPKVTNAELHTEISQYLKNIFKLSYLTSKINVFPEVKLKASQGEVDFKYTDYVMNIVRDNIDPDNKSIVKFFKFENGGESKNSMQFATKDVAFINEYEIDRSENDEYEMAIIGDSIILSTGKNIYSFIPIVNTNPDSGKTNELIVAGSLDEFAEDVSYEESVITGLNRLGTSPLLMVKDRSKLDGFDFGVKDVIITDDYTFIPKGTNGSTDDVDNRRLSIVKEPNKDHYAFSQITLKDNQIVDKYEWTLYQLGDDQQWKEMKGSMLGWKGNETFTYTATEENWSININSLKEKQTGNPLPWSLDNLKKLNFIITAEKPGTTPVTLTLDGDVIVDKDGKARYTFVTYGAATTTDRFEGVLDTTGLFKLYRKTGTELNKDSFRLIGVSQYRSWEIGISYPDMTKVNDNKTTGTTFSKTSTGKESFIRIDSYALNANTSYQLQLKITGKDGSKDVSQIKIINFVVKSREIGETVSEVKSLWDEMKTCKYVANFDDKLVLYGNGTQQIYTSELSRPYFITAEEIVKADSFGKGEDVISIQNFKDTKIIFTKSTMMSMTGSGNTEANDPYHVLPLDGAVGCVGHLAVTPIENTLAFVGKDGIYMIEQISVAEQRVQLAKISSQINKEALPYFDVVDKVDEQLFSDIVATNLEQRLIISYPQKEYMLVFDYGTDGVEKGKWTKWISNIIPIDFLIKENVLYMLDYVDPMKVFIKQPKITNDIYDQEYPVSFFQDAGVTYEFKYVSKYSELGLPYEAKKIKRIFTTTDNKWDGNVSYDVEMLADGYPNFNYHVGGDSYNRPLIQTGVQWGTLTTFRKEHNIHSHIELISKPGRLVRIIITNKKDEPFALKGIQLEFNFSKAKGKQISK